jgi:hypothetical protein
MELAAYAVAPPTARLRVVDPVMPQAELSVGQLFERSGRGDGQAFEDLYVR